MARWILGLVAIVVAVADRQQQRLVGQEQQSPTRMRRRLLGFADTENDATANQPVALEAGFPDRGAIGFFGAFRERHVDRPIGREIGVEHDIEQAAVLLAEDVGRATGHRRTGATAGLDPPQPAALLADQERAIGQEGQRPGGGERRTDLLDLEAFGRRDRHAVDGDGHLALRLRGRYGRGHQGQCAFERPQSHEFVPPAGTIFDRRRRLWAKPAES